MLNITNHQGNSNTNHNETSPHTCQDGYFFKKIPKPKMKQKHNKCWKEFGKIGILVHSRRFLKKLKIEPQYDPWIPLPGIYPKEWKAGSWEDTGTPFFTAALHITASCGTSPRAHWQVTEGENVESAYNGMLCSPEKKQHLRSFHRTIVWSPRAETTLPDQ